MNNKIPTLKRWVQFHNVLAGYAHHCPGIAEGQRVITGHVHEIDRTLWIAKCTGNEIWKLDQPGTIAEHNIPQKSGINFRQIFESSLDKISDIKRQWK